MFDFDKQVSPNSVFQFGVSAGNGPVSLVQLDAAAAANSSKNRRAGSKDGKKKQEQRNREWLRRQKSVEKEGPTEMQEEKIGGARKKH